MSMLSLCVYYDLYGPHALLHSSFTCVYLYVSLCFFTLSVLPYFFLSFFLSSVSQHDLNLVLAQTSSTVQSSTFNQFTYSLYLLFSVFLFSNIISILLKPLCLFSSRPIPSSLLSSLLYPSYLYKLKVNFVQLPFA